MTRPRIAGLTQKESDYVGAFSDPTSQTFLDTKASKQKAGYCPDSVWKTGVSARAERAAIQAMICTPDPERLAQALDARLDEDFTRFALPVSKLLMALEAGEEPPTPRIVIRPLVRKDSQVK